MFDLLMQFLDVIFHIDKYLVVLFEQYGLWMYALLFLIIFLETGVVFTPMLPGDSLLFAIGALATQTSLNPFILVGLLSLAAILGDTTNYWIGHYIGPKVFHKKRRFIKQEYLLKTEAFYEAHGGKTIILARFIPVIRTFAPFVAGIGKMKYGRFLMYNVVGGLAWVTLFLLAGYYFGAIPAVKENFTLVILAIIVISFIPVIIEFIKHKTAKVRS